VAVVAAARQRAARETKCCFRCKRPGVTSNAWDESRRFCGEACYVAHCAERGADPERCSNERCDRVAVPGTRAGAKCQQCWLAFKKQQEAAGYARRKRQRAGAE
jgi:hypothetical protein